MTHSRAAALVVAILVVPACGKRGEDSAMAKIAAALDSVSAEQRPMLAASALEDAIGADLPSGLAEGLRAYNALPEQRNVMLAAAIATPSTLAPLNVACGGNAAKAIAESVALPRAEQVAHVWTSCGFARYKLIGEEEARGASVMTVAFAHALLVERGGDAVSGAERKVIRALIAK